MSRYKILLGLLVVACLACARVSASDSSQICEFSPVPVVAHYTFVSHLLNSDRKTNKYSNIALSLWREGDRNGRVAHSFSELQQSEVWNRLPNGLLRVVKHFDAHARAIEYESIDIKLPRVENAWTSKYHLIPHAMHSKISSNENAPVQPSNKCESEHSYYDLQQGVRYDAVWSRQWLLPVSLTAISDSNAGKVITLLKLESIENNRKIIALQFEQWDSHRTTDFADLGDNENDPFIQKMISLGLLSHGASGFYNSNGHSFSNAHKH